MMHTDVARVDIARIESDQEVIGRDTRTVRTDDGVTIAYRVLGTGPRSVMFLHGWSGAGTGHSWADVMKELDLVSGKWAQWMSCTAPERVIGQVLVAPAPAIESPIPEAEKNDGW
jgi:hypothetical protein